MNKLLVFHACIAVVLLLLLPCIAQAKVSLGSTTGSRTVVATPGGSASFRVLLFNMHDNEIINVNFRATGPDGWDVFADYESIDLAFSPSGRCYSLEGYECLGTGSGDVMAFPVNVHANIPVTAGPGNYEIKFSAIVKGSGNSQLNMQQERSYVFTAVIEGDNTIDKQDIDVAEPIELDTYAEPKNEQNAEQNLQPHNNESPIQVENDAKTIEPIEQENASPEIISYNSDEANVTGMVSFIGIGYVTIAYAVIIIFILLGTFALYNRD